MTGVEGLRGALAGRYDVEREVGHGAMATVFLARDLRYDRRVAVKVLNRELAAALGPERFLREIDILAHLNHPHILPLLDSGDAGGFLYYVMPFVEGESLRHRLERETQLPVGEALAIAREVALALDYAHRQGFIHRDVKPENILLSDGLALVADFGIARAVNQAIEVDRLTGHGVSPGTPPYMSPEQASGGGAVDSRSDVYALACVLYELLAGNPPFIGPTAQAVLARHLADPVPPLRTVRPTVPVGVEHAVFKALAKVPADRFATAAEFATALAAAQTEPRTPGQRRSVWLPAFAAVTILLVAAAYWLSQRTPTLDQSIVAVLPFRFVGDSALGYLREGMLDLLAAKLNGAGGLSSADPQAVMRSWRRLAGSDTQDLPRASSLRLAQRLGAGKALLGSIIGVTNRLIFNVTLVRVPSGKSLGTATVQGPPDSLLSLVDRLTGQVLAQEAGLDEPRLVDVTSTSLPALRLYLNGAAAYRLGHYEDAVLLFRQALAEDSMFALAALGLRSATAWIASSPETGPAWALRGRLSPRDRAVLEGLVGPRYPELSSEREFLSAWEAAVTAAPAEAEAWFELGDALYHAGGVLSEDPLHTRASDAFHRALQLDSEFTAPLVHLIDFAAQSGHAGALQQLSRLYFARDSVGEIVDYLRWRTATSLGDSAALTQLSARMSTMAGESLRRIVVAAQLDGIPTDDAERAASAWVRSSHTSVDRWFAFLREHDLMLNRGAPAPTLALTDSLHAVWPRSHAYLRVRVADALYAEGSTAAAAQAIEELTPSIGAALPADRTERAEQYADACTVEQWRLVHGDARSASRSIARLLGSSSHHDSPETDAYNHWCAIALQALLVSTKSPTTVTAALRTLDSLLSTGPRPLEITYSDFFRSFMFGNLLAARLHEEAGDAPGALATVRRRPYIGAGTTFLASSFRTEGRLAALTGDRDGAIRAYRHYLALRLHPEPSVAPEVFQVRAELSRLERR